MSSVEIVPVDTQQFEMGLARLRKEADSIVVKDQVTYVAACQIALDARSYVKDVKGKMNPGIVKAKALVDSLKNDLLKWITPAEQIDNIVSQKAEAWKRAEREAAERERQRLQREAEAKAREIADAERRESDRIAKEQRIAREKELEEQRKAGEINRREQARLAKIAADEELQAKALARQQEIEAAAAVPEIHVAPAVPKVAGIRGRVNFYAEIVDTQKFLDLIFTVKTDRAEIEFLRQFICVDQKAVGAYARKTKNTDAVKGSVPYVHAWEEDGI